MTSKKGYVPGTYVQSLKHTLSMFQYAFILSGVVLSDLLGTYIYVHIQLNQLSCRPFEYQCLKHVTLYYAFNNNHESFVYISAYIDIHNLQIPERKLFDRERGNLLSMYFQLQENYANYMGDIK